MPGQMPVRHVLVTAFLVGICLISGSEGVVKKSRKRVVCYYTNWSVYRLGLAKFLPSNINPHLCTHLIYAFGGFNDDFELQPFDKYQDIEKGGYARFNGLKQYNKGLRTLLALGGWNEGSGRFSELVADEEYRKRFVLSVIRYLRQYNFDGLDLDWEYPGSRAGSDDADKQNYARLCEELRAAFEQESIKTNRPVLLLTMAVPAGVSTINKGFDVARLNAVVDFFNILAYDYHASSEPLTDHHAPLLAQPGASQFDYRSELNVDYTVRYYVKLGAERRKLVVGIPTYGRSYTLLDAAYHDLQAAADSPGLKGKYTKEDGYLSFYEVCEMIAVNEWQVFRPFPERMGPYATKDKQWVGYDDEFAVAKKAEYVRDNYLGGIMFWSIDNDDFRGRCSGQPYPLIEAAKKAYLKPATGSPPKQQKAPTPPPPPTPDPGADFSCKREGFYAHPRECNKYFWCLGGGPLGIVPHSFTCPTGLLFNRNTDACDFPRSVKCKIAEPKHESITFPPTKKPLTTRAPATLSSTADPLDSFYDYYDTDDLPPIGVDDLSDHSLDHVLSPVLAAGVRPTPAREVLGGSRGSVEAVRSSASSQDDSEESDPADLKQLLSLITDLGGVDGVERLLRGDGSQTLFSDKDRKALTRIVSKQQGRTTERPGFRDSSSWRKTATPAPSGGNSRRRPNVVRPSGLQNSGGRPASGDQSISRLSGTNTRRQPAVSNASRQGALNTRRRPQYTNVERIRTSAPSVAAAENSNFRPRYTSIERSRSPASKQTTSARGEQQWSQHPVNEEPGRTRASLNDQSTEQRKDGDDELGSRFADTIVRQAIHSSASDNLQVVARRSDSHPDAALSLLPALAGVGSTGGVHVDAASKSAETGNDSTHHVIRQETQQVRQDAATDVRPVFSGKSIFDVVRPVRLARRRTLLQSVERSTQPSDVASDSIIIQDTTERKRSSSTSRNRGSTRFSFRRGARRRPHNVSHTTTTQQSPKQKEPTPNAPSPATATGDISTKTFQLESSTERNSALGELESGSSRGAGRFFRLGGRRLVGRERNQPKDDLQTGLTIFEKELKLSNDEKTQQPSSSTTQQPIIHSLQPSEKESENTGASRTALHATSARVQERTPTFSARRVSQRKTSLVFPSREATTSSSTESFPDSVISSQNEHFSKVAERPDPLRRDRTRNRSLLRLKSPVVATLPTRRSFTEKAATELETEGTTEVVQQFGESRIDLTTTETNQKVLQPFQAPRNRARIRPFPFRPRSGKRKPLLSRQPLTSLVSNLNERNNLGEGNEIEEHITTKIEIPTSTEADDEESTTSVFQLDDLSSTTVPTEKSTLPNSNFRASTLPSRRSSTLRPPFRTRPTSSISLYDLVKNRDDDSKRHHVQSLVDQLKLSLSAQSQEKIEAEINTHEPDIPDTRKTTWLEPSTTSSASVSVSTTEKHTTITMSDDDDSTEIVVLPAVSTTTLTFNAPTELISTGKQTQNSLDLRPIYVASTEINFDSPSTTFTVAQDEDMKTELSTDIVDLTDNSGRSDFEGSGDWIVTPDVVFSEAGSREARVFFTDTETYQPKTLSTHAPSSTISTTRPKFFEVDKGAFIVTAATLPPQKIASSVSVKVSVSTSDSQSPNNSDIQLGSRLSTTTESPVDALFNMLSEKEKEEALQPLDVISDAQYLQQETVLARSESPLLQASLFNQLPALLRSPPTGGGSNDRESASVDAKSSLFDPNSILSFSTVTPRYEDPDSFFKRKTFLSAGAGGLCKDGSWLTAVSLAAITLLAVQHYF